MFIFNQNKSNKEKIKEEIKNSIEFLIEQGILVKVSSDWNPDERKAEDKACMKALRYTLADMRDVEPDDCEFNAELMVINGPRLRDIGLLDTFNGE